MKARRREHCLSGRHIVGNPPPPMKRMQEFRPLSTVRRSLAFVWLCLALAVPSVRAQDVDAGSLRARLSTEPWSLTFSEPSGRVVLRESLAASPLGPGPIGFRTPAGWVHATRVVSSSRGRDELTV